jgi:hypothetical protein
LLLAQAVATGTLIVFSAFTFHDLHGWWWRLAFVFYCLSLTSVSHLSDRAHAWEQQQ